MTTSEAREKAKLRLDIPVATSTFDAMLDEFVGDSVSRLAPVLYETYIASDYTLAKDTHQVALSAIDADLVFIDKIWTKDSTADDDSFEVLSSDEYDTVVDQLVLRLTFDVAQTFRVEGSKPYVIANIPAHYELVVVYWTLAEFYETLAGNKRKFNTYQEIVGTRSIDAMAENAERMESKGNDLLMDRVEMGGA